MTHGALHVSAIALGVAAFVSVYAAFHRQRGLAPVRRGAALARGRARQSAPLAEPAPTPSIATSPSGGTASAPGEANGAALMPPERPSHIYGGHTARHAHYAWRHGRRYAAYSRNPVGAAANVVVGGVADLGSIAAYPFYCFPRYGSCPFYRPYP